MHCYNCGKDIKQGEASHTLDDLNYTHHDCLYPVVKSEDTDSTVTPASHTLVLLPTDNYAFKDVELKGNEWIEINTESHWACMQVAAKGIFLCLNSCWGTYCFVFFDEADQCSQPYPTVQEAMDARKRYMENL